MSEFEAKIRAAGVSATESAAKAALLEKLTQHLRDMHGGSPTRTCAFFVPGRLEFLGKHTDYAGGRSIVSAIERGICMVAAPRADAQVLILDMERKSEALFALNPQAEARSGHWSIHAVTVARRFARDFPAARIGADIMFASDLPAAAGMSSSSALIVAVFIALAEVNSLWESDYYRAQIRGREDLAGYLAAVESGAEFGAFSGNRGVGTMGGSEDHVAILCSRAGFLRQYSYCPVRLEREITMPGQFSFVIGDSGVKADKTGNALESYNRISLAARKVFDLWKSATGRNDVSLAAALASGTGAFAKLFQIVRDSSDSEFSNEILLNRLKQFSEESNEIVPAASSALARGAFDSVGALADRSQLLAEELLGNQTPETVELARAARALGAAAASAFGAGFGGSVWALVSRATAEEFRVAWKTRYIQKYPERSEAAQFFITRPGPGVIQF